MLTSRQFWNGYFEIRSQNLIIIFWQRVIILREWKFSHLSGPSSFKGRRGSIIRGHFRCEMTAAGTLRIPPDSNRLDLANAWPAHWSSRATLDHPSSPTPPNKEECCLLQGTTPRSAVGLTPRWESAADIWDAGHGQHVEMKDGQRWATSPTRPSVTVMKGECLVHEANRHQTLQRQISCQRWRCSGASLQAPPPSQLRWLPRRGPGSPYSYYVSPNISTQVFVSLLASDYFHESSKFSNVLDFLGGFKDLSFSHVFGSQFEETSWHDWLTRNNVLTEASPSD